MEMFRNYDGTTDWFSVTFAGVLSSMFAGMIALIVIFEPPKTFSLIKDDWECTAVHTEPGMTAAPGLAMNGQVTMVMIPTTDTICDRYTRKGH